MSGLDLEKLKQYRDEILKAEIGALLFNFGKTHIGFNFWRNYFPHKSSEFKFSSYKEYAENHFYSELEEISLQLKNFFENININLDFWNTQFLELLKGGESGDDFVKKIFFRGCENINSGIDKGSPNQQLEPPLWLSNAFGSFKEEIKENNFDEEREKFLKNLYRCLKRQGYLNETTNINWTLIRNYVSKKIKKWYSHLLSDSRFPINDVSLYDQAYMTASMFKAVLSHLVMDSSKLDTYQSNPSNIKWRILGIQYDKVGVAEKSLKLASISWYREITEKIDEEIKNLLEVEYPIGNEIYRDETGIYFLVGEDLGKDLNNNKNLAKLKGELREIENRILEIFKKLTDDEFYSAIFLTKASRGLMNLSTLLENARENFLKANWKKKNRDLCLIRSINGKAIGICPICQVRLIYEKDKEKLNNPTICEVCDRRIHHKQVSKWIDNLTGETIWIDEIKDKNSRVVYTSLKFELKDWLSGNLLNSLLGQQIKFPINNKCKNYKQLISNICDDIKENKKLNQTCLKDYHSNIPNIRLKQLLETWLLERSIGQSWEEFIYKQLNDWDLQNDKPIKQKIDFDERKIYWDKLNNDDIEFLATLLLQFLLRKNPSPARLRRIWETTREFFEEIHKNLDQILEIPEWRKKRLVWEVDLNGNNKLTKSMELEGDGLTFWAEKEGNKAKIYLITSIDDFLEKFGNEEIKKALNDKNIDINTLKNKLINKEITLKPAYSSNNDENNKNLIKFNIQNLLEIHTYKPFTKITDPSPINYQIVIPAEYIPNFIDKVMEMYNKEFKYVYGKLPIHIGVVISDYLKPLYLNLKALRRIRRNVKDIDNLYINKNQIEFKKYFRHKTIYYGEKEAKEYERKNKTIEYYSLFWDKLKKGDYNFYIKPSPKLNKNCSLKWKKWLIPADKLKNKFKTVQIIPNTFDFEYLDHNVRRNEIFYDVNGKRVLRTKEYRPYEIETHWDKFKAFRDLLKNTNLQTSRLHKLVDILYSKVLYEEKFNKNYIPLFLSSLVKWLELNKKGEIYKQRRKLVAKIFDLNTNNFDKLTDDYKNKLKRVLEDEENIYLFLDMFEFWHTALKEV